MSVGPYGDSKSHDTLLARSETFRKRRGEDNMDLDQ